MEPYLANFELSGPLWLGAYAGAIFLASLLSALVFNWWLFPVILRATDWIPTNLDTKLEWRSPARHTGYCPAGRLPGPHFAPDTQPGATGQG